MLVDFSMYGLEELHEIEKELANEISEREIRLVKITDAEDNGTMEDSIDEVRYEL